MFSLKLLLALLALTLSPARDSESMLDFAPVAMDLQHGCRQPLRPHLLVRLPQWSRYGHSRLRLVLLKVLHPLRLPACCP